MEINERDLELVDAYFDGNLSDEELALFRIRMQDEEFEHFVRFQRQLRDEFNESKSREPLYTPLRYSSQRGQLAREMGSKLWYVMVATLIIAALGASIFLR